MFSSNSLTNKQTQILDFLRHFKKKEGLAPTYREISKHFGFKSTKAALDHVRALEKKGYVRRHGNRSRGIEVLSSETNSVGHAVSIPILGEVPAGMPENKKENKSNTLAIDETVLGNCKEHRLYALKVEGDSMTGRNICDGDWVVVDAEANASEGEIVVALIDGDTTLKTLSRDEKHFYLKSENPDYPDWNPIEEIIVQGVVKALIRQV